MMPAQIEDLTKELDHANKHIQFLCNIAKNKVENIKDDAPKKDTQIIKKIKNMKKKFS